MEKNNEGKISLDKTGKAQGRGAYICDSAECLEKADTSDLSDDAKVGFKIVKRALEEPIRQIAENAGLDGSVIVAKVRETAKVGYGFDAYNEKYCDMVESGIVDPAKVTRSALQNAASIASTVLTTESVVYEKKEPKAAAPAAPDMGGMY